MDDRSLRALLARGEREWGGGARGSRGIAAFWAVAAVILTALGAYLGAVFGRSASLTPLPRALALGPALVFWGLALYAWFRLLRAFGDR